MTVEAFNNTDGSQGIPEKDKRTFRKHLRIGRLSITILSLLFLELLLGMYANLFAAFPSQSPSVDPIDSVLVNGPYVVSAHIINGIALGILSIAAIVLSVFARNRRAIFLSCIGFISILFAGESGVSFALGWYTNNYFSYSMTVGFALSLAIYFVLSASYPFRSLSSSKSG